MSTRAHRNPAWNNVNINMMSDDELLAAVDTLDEDVQPSLPPFNTRGRPTSTADQEAG